MRNPFTTAMMALAGVLAFASLSITQTQAPAGASNKPNAPTGGPAPIRDLTGSWSGPVQIERLSTPPPLTPLGQKLMSTNKPESKFHISGTNDNFARTCDPLGFPRNIVFEIRGLQFATMPDRIIILHQYQRIWREAWMDGRELPKNVGSTAKGAPDPRYYGYSVGSWVDDYTFVVNTTGFNENAWADELGHPRSMHAMVEDRHHRIDHDTLEVTVTIDDPK